tara:strand:+ start:256 stop:411 length:156 start_codon:yes stop_codon:yes gene_type:complete
MQVGEEIWKQLKSEVETLLSKDSNITDLIISYQLKQTEGNRHYGSINIKTK